MTDIGTAVTHKVKHYIKKPIPVRAVQIERDSFAWIKDWIISCAVGDERVDFGPHAMSLVGNGSIMTGAIGDWVIQGVQGEFYICPRDVFANSYREA